MQVYLDETLCEVGSAAAAVGAAASTTDLSVGEAIAAAAVQAEQQGRMIIEVLVDGEAWTEEQLGSPELIQSTANELRLTTADPALLLAQTFGDAAEVLGDIDAMQQSAAEHMQADEQPQSMAKLGDAIQLWTAVQQAVERGVELLDLSLDAIEIEGDSIRARIDALSKQLRNLQSGLSESDPVLLSDTLLYDLPDVVNSWREMLLHLQELAMTRANDE